MLIIGVSVVEISFLCIPDNGSTQESTNFLRGNLLVGLMTNRLELVAGLKLHCCPIGTVKELGRRNDVGYFVEPARVED